jgi:signal transduction histidine kinase
MSDGDVSPEQERLRRALLAERLAAVGSLADGLAHEIHNPLNCALLQLAVLQRRLELPDCQPPTLQPVTQLIEQALRRLELLFNDFASLVRADGDQVGIQVPLDLPPIERGLPSLLAQLWPSSTEMSSDAGTEALPVRPREPPP